MPMCTVVRVSVPVRSTHTGAHTLTQLFYQRQDDVTSHCTARSVTIGVHATHPEFGYLQAETIGLPLSNKAAGVNACVRTNLYGKWVCAYLRMSCRRRYSGCELKIEKYVRAYASLVEKCNIQVIVQFSISLGQSTQTLQEIRSFDHYVYLHQFQHTANEIRMYVSSSRVHSTCLKVYRSMHHYAEGRFPILFQV